MKQQMFTLLFFIGLPFTLCSQNGPNRLGEELFLKVMSYNIHHGRGMDGKINLKRIAKIVKKANVDLVALQEVDVLTNRSGKLHQAQILADLTGMQVAFGKAMDFDTGQYGNAILTKFDIEEKRVLQLPSKEPRCALLVKIAPKPHKTLYFASTHLDTQRKQRRASASLLKKNLSKVTGTMLLAGDFNATPNSPTMKNLTKSGWHSVRLQRPLFTVPVGLPKKQIDYILYRPKSRWKVIEAKVINEPQASDHRPLVVKLKWVAD